LLIGAAEVLIFVANIVAFVWQQMAIRLIAPERTARSATWAAARRKALTKTKVFNRQEV